MDIQVPPRCPSVSLELVAWLHQIFKPDPTPIDPPGIYDTGYVNGQQAVLRHLIMEAEHQHEVQLETKLVFRRQHTQTPTSGETAGAGSPE